MARSSVSSSTSSITTTTATTTSTSTSTTAGPSIQNSAKPYHPEWGVMKDQDFHPLTHKHQRDLETLYQSGAPIPDFYFWQANLGGYCMANMLQNIVVWPEGIYALERRIVEGAPHPGRKKKKSAD
ncbi:hypothetical protein CLU79DRAFT_708752 [Phycomyces nitens]|nr:hypothetical protein CLU79DRAFT_708752 [Phycomyces nitens]